MLGSKIVSEKLYVHQDKNETNDSTLASKKVHMHQNQDERAVPNISRESLLWYRKAYPWEKAVSAIPPLACMGP
jgi:hypothetical protein